VDPVKLILGVQGEVDMGLFGPPDVKKLTAKRDLKGLIKAVGHSDSSVSGQAIEALKRLGDAPIDVLLDELRSPNKGVRTSASTVLERLEWKAQNDEDRSWSLLATEDWITLVQMDAAAVPSLVRITLDRSYMADFPFPHAVAISLAAMTGPAAVDTLAKAADALTGPAALALGLSGGSDEAVRALAQGLKSSAADDVKIQISYYLGLCGASAGDALIDVIATGDRIASMYAVIALGITGDSRAPTVLQSLRGTRDSELKEIVNMTEEVIQDPPRSQIAALSSPIAFKRVFAAMALGNRRDEEGVPALVAATRDAMVEVRGQSAGALGKIGTPAAKNALVSLLGEADDPGTLIPTIRSLAAIGDRSGLDAVGMLRSDPSMSVRAQATLAMAGIGSWPKVTGVQSHCEVEFDADGKVTSIAVPQGSWASTVQGNTNYYTQKAGSLLQAAEILKTLGTVGEVTYYVVETPDGSLCRDLFGFYTEAPLKTKGLVVASACGERDMVEFTSLKGFGDQMGQQRALAQLKTAGQYMQLVLLMACGRCGYESPVETRAGPLVRECYCCGTDNKGERGTINVFFGGSMVEI